jgi:hypothetical protein
MGEGREKLEEALRRKQPKALPRTLLSDPVTRLI